MNVTSDVLSRLDAFVGEWEVSASIGEGGAGRTVFEWVEDGAFLAERSTAPDPFPSGVSIIGPDDGIMAYQQLYHDSRGVSRIYRMSLEDGVWRLERDAPGWHQRFEGRFSDDGRTIDGAWHKSEDGVDWELDFTLTYRKVR